MSEVVKVSARDGVAVVEVCNPPVNALSQAVRQGLVDAMARVASDDGIQAAILIGAGRTFPAGADIREFDAPAQEPHLPDVCNAIENCPKPVVACLHGTALGGGYEIALAAHARLATPGTRVGLPEIGLGVMPGAGGTQRLPRLVAVEDALSMILSGAPVDAAKTREKGYVDGIVEGDLASAGITFAKSLVGKPLKPVGARRERFSDGFGYQAAVDAARREAGEDASRARRAIIDCIEAAPLLPFDQGLALERDHFLELRETVEAKALRHVFLATRLAVKPRPDLPEPANVSQVAIFGGGLMGSGITVSCLDAGFSVIVIEQPEALERTRARVGGIYDRAVERGRLSPQMRDERLSRLSVDAEKSAIASADLILEAVPDDRDLKAQLFRDIAAHAKPGAILATNTSYLDVDDLAETSGRPQDFVGLHFFSPAHVQQAMEVVVGRETSALTEATAFAFGNAIKKKPVRSENAEGFIGNRVLTAYRRAADYLLEDGASPSEIDAAMRAFGFKMGPYQVLDMAGLDISWARRKRLGEATAEGTRYVRIGDAMCEAGRFGQKTAKGYYRYEEGSRTPLTDPEATAIIDRERAAKGVTPREISSEEIQRTCLIAMMNEGGKLLDESVAERAGDIDILMILGLGFPREKGGPMKAAELAGLLGQLRDLETWSKEDVFWTPSKALKNAVKNGSQF
ncbi:MAG: 3-hydroxyacyl-CoA dehydrogenase NAD-binding domain-containing protein [Rhodobacteraceae bacterium]|nr:3-hydroxyacyl-CoA dehydrogenase NAD-binding domain-containing protein [Paracoccaceae bacterium]